jgi:hypothetical protein
MDLNEYTLVVKERYGNLSEEEKETVRRTSGTPVGIVLNKLLGQELGKAVTIGQPTTTIPKRSGLGSR